MPGTISDSRIGGDVLYVVGFEDGSCWSCERSKPTTSVSSLDVANPREMRKIDQLRYAESNGQYYWRRSITVTNQRLYIAGPEYGEQGPVGSSIQVIDISDPAGDLVPGATVEAHGQVSSRWQMDEYDGVLRVVSQSPAWRTTDPPQLQTFKVISSSELEPLAKLDLAIPANESLQSARFDGPRGYVITAERKDPLFTLDLADPANPKQVGELVMPGFVYHMEPRGDRVLGLGFDQGNPEGSITVSLFDVSDLASPKLLSRVNFGGDWGALPEDQDRIHKVFRVLPEDGVILVPFTGYRRDEDNEYCKGASLGGVQLVDFANDTLHLRGAAPSDMQVRRALIHREHLLAASDQRIESFEIADRDAPELASKTIIASLVNQAVQLDGGVVARLVSADYGEDWSVEIVRKADAENVDTRLSELNLDSVFDTSDACGHWWSIDSAHAEGSTLFLLYSGYRQLDRATSENEMGVIAVDASNPATPRIASRTSWVEPQGGDSSGWGASYGDYYGGYGSSSRDAWHDGVLSFFEVKYDYVARSDRSTTRTRLRVVDLRDPEKPKTTTLALGDNRSYTGLITAGDQLLTTRYDVPATGDRPSRIKLFAERIDVSTPSAPKLVGSVNVPGVVTYFDRASGRAVTSLLRGIVVPGLTSEACYARFGQASYTVDDDQASSSKGTCTGFTQSLQLVSLRSDGAVLEDTIALQENQQATAFAAGDGRLFVTLGVPYRNVFRRPGVTQPEHEPIQLLVLSGFADGKLDVGRLEFESGDENSWRGFWTAGGVIADGDKAFLYSAGPGEGAVVDASDGKAPKIIRAVPLAGRPNSFDLNDGTLLLSLGQQGLQSIEF
ncbi:MAG TPA: beta-propeller domain-containing protein [Polyangiales bacterium]|nr:beta-propeller domain-containing protein [Polyangiales bacterium]